MEGLLNWFGWTAWGPVVALALPLAVGGLWLRAAARQRLESLALTRAARRKPGDVAAGVVTVEGTWRAVRGGDGLVEDEGGDAVLVAREPGAEAIADGARVLVVGVAGGEGDDPRGSGYRGHARLPRVVAGGLGHFVTTEPALLERQTRAAQLRATVGAALFAAAVALTAATALVAWRATE